MSDSFFGFNQSDMPAKGNNLGEEEAEDDIDYDALNNETFGEVYSERADWEEVHAMLQSELEQQFDEENSELSERVASSILEDEVEPQKVSEEPAISKPTTPVFNDLFGASCSNGSTYRPSNVHMPTTPRPPPQILTVEELERKMRREAEMIHSRQAGSSPISSLPFEHTPSCSNVRRNMSSNGHFNIRNRPTNTSTPLMNQHPRGRFQNNERRIPECYVRQPFPPDLLPGPRHPPTPRQPPPIYHPPRNSGHNMYQRFPGDYFVTYGPQRQHMSMPDYRPPPPQFYHHQNRGAYGNIPFQPPIDEYAGMMTPQEKQWLASIQLMQLTSNQPLQDDYYFIMFQQRQQGNSGRKIISQPPKNNRDTTSKPASSNYTLTQFENSLGKLQIGSVTAPRKIIDKEVVENIETSHKHHVERKSKQILMEIEEMFNGILELEGPHSDDEIIDSRSIQDKLLQILLSGNKLVSVMAIRKGRSGVLRLHPLLEDSSALTHQILIDMILITKKDTEPLLLLLLSYLPNVRTYLSRIDLKSLVDITKHYDTSLLFANKFTISVLANMVERAEQIVTDAEHSHVEMWLNFLCNAARSSSYWTNTERPVVAVPKNILTAHLDRIKNIAEEEHIQGLIRVLCVLKPVTAGAHTSNASHVPAPALVTLPALSTCDALSSAVPVPISVSDDVPSNADTKI